MNRMWVQYSAWQECVATYKRGEVLSRVAPSSFSSPEGIAEVEIWAQVDKQPCRVADAYLYGRAEMHLCDVPDWVMAKYYAPQVRSVADLLGNWQNKQVKPSTRVYVFLFAIK